VRSALSSFVLLLSLEQSKNLHLLLLSLATYVERYAIPPTSPTLPDMHSSTTSYVTLHNLYKVEFQSDLNNFTTILHQLLSDIGLSLEAVTAEEIESFARGVGGVGIVSGTSLRGRESGEGIRKESSR
jgi:amyloid beta precursor protein binding protein 1